MESQHSRVEEFARTFSLNVMEFNDCYILTGIVFVMARIDDYSISKNYTIRIEIAKIGSFNKKTYSTFVPKIQVIEGMLHEKYSHVYKNKYICLDTDLFQYMFLLNNKFNYIEWFRFYFYSFAVKYEFYIEYGTNIGDDRSHGSLGLLESLSDYLCIPKTKINKFNNSILNSQNNDSINSIVKRYCFKNKIEFDWYVQCILIDYIKLREKEKRDE